MTVHRLLNRMIAMVWLLGGARTGMAQQAAKQAGDTSSVSRLGPVIVTATKTPRTREDLPLSTSVLRADEVRATPALTLDDVLRTIPGLNVPFESAVVAHYTSNALSMRGIGGYVTTLVLLDGIPINDPMSGYVQWLKVPMELVDRVEVVRGGSSSLYGTYALGGVVNIITRHATGDEGAADASYGTNNSFRSNLLGSTALSSSVRLTVNGNFYNTSGYVRPVPEDRGPIDLPGRSRAGNGFAQLDFHLSEQASAFVRANYYDMYQNQGSRLATDGQRVFDLDGGIQRRAGIGGTVSANVFYQHDAPWTYNTDPITARGQDEFMSNYHRTPADFFGGAGQWTSLSTSGKTSTTLGGDVHVVTGDDISDVYSAPNVFAYHEVGGGTQLTAGAFGQVEYFPTAALELLGSARFDVWQNHNGHDDKTPGGQQHFADQTRGSLNPKLAIRYRASDAWTLRGAAYRAFNAPNLDELYRPYSAASYANVPNPQLGPEALLGGEIGTEYARGPAMLQVNVFQNNLSDVISYNPISFSPVYTTMPVNVGSVRTRGVEVFGNLDLTTGWRFSASYTYTASVITDNPPDQTIVGNTQGDTPKIQVAGSAGYFGSRWSVFVQPRYVSRRYTDVSNALVISPYTVVDASGSLRLTPNVEAFAQVENVLDRLYVVSEYGFHARGAPRQLFAGVRTRFGALAPRTVIPPGRGGE